MTTSAPLAVAAAAEPGPGATVSPPCPAGSRPARPRWGWKRVVLLILGSGLAFGLAGTVALAISLWPGGEVRALRQAVAGELNQAVEPRFTFGVGRLILGIARVVTLLAPVEPEARTALSALRGADVSVATLATSPSPAECRALLETAGDVMERRGWQRLVGVLDGRSTVGVYVPQNLKSPRDVRVAVLAVDGTDLVTVTARADLQPLLRWVEEKGGPSGWRGALARGF